MPSNLPQGMPVSQKCFFRIINVYSSSLLPGSEFRDAPSDHVCKFESVKPFFPLCSMKRNCNFNIDPKNFHVPKPPKLAPPVPMGSCAASKATPWHPGGGSDPQGLAEECLVPLGTGCIQEGSDNPSWEHQCTEKPSAI